MKFCPTVRNIVASYKRDIINWQGILLIGRIQDKLLQKFRDIHPRHTLKVDYYNTT